MHVNETLILKLENLARLQLEVTERNQLMQDLEKMLHMVDTLKSLDTQDVEPLVYLSDEATYASPDLVTEHLARPLALRNAPLHNDAYFMVPKVIGNTE